MRVRREEPFCLSRSVRKWPSQSSPNQRCSLRSVLITAELATDAGEAEIWKHDNYGQPHMHRLRQGFELRPHLSVQYVNHWTIKVSHTHWRRLVKNIGEQTKILWGQKVINALAILNYWGARARAAPLSLRLCPYSKTLGQ